MEDCAGGGLAGLARDTAGKPAATGPRAAKTACAGRLAKARADHRRGLSRQPALGDNPQAVGSRKTQVASLVYTMDK